MPAPRAWSGVRSRTWSTSPTARSAAASTPGPARRNYYIGITGVDTFVTMQFTSDFQEKDIVFGGDKKLAKIIDEIERTVPAGQGHLGPVRMPGRPDRRRHRSRSSKKTAEGIEQADHPGALRRLPRRLPVARATTSPTTRSATGSSTTRDVRRARDDPYDVAHHRRLQHRRRRLVVKPHPARRDGPARHRPLDRRRHLAEIEHTPKVKLNLIHCYRSMNYICRHMEEKYGIPWVEFNFFGPTKIARACARSPSYFDDKHQGEGARAVIAKYEPMMEAVIDKYKPAPGGQEGHAVRRRPAPAPRRRRLRGSRHGQ